MAESSTGAVPKGGGGGGATSGYHGPPQQQGAQHRGPPPLRNVVDINQFSHIDPERWICIYPAYLNSRKSRAEGRLVPRDKGIADPNWMECQHVLAPKGFRFLVEPGKGYPKERSREPHFRGRVRLQLKGEDGQPLNPEFKTRMDVMLYICQEIPKLKSRQESARKAAESVHESSKSSAGGGGGGGGKKGGGAGKKSKKK